MVVGLSFPMGNALAQAPYAPPYGPFNTYSSCVQSAGNREFHGYIITEECNYYSPPLPSPGYYYRAYYP
jgi:hypothetical protein